LIALLLLYTTTAAAQLPDSLRRQFSYQPLHNPVYTTDSSYTTGTAAIQKIRYYSTDSFLVTAYIVQPLKVRGKLPLVVFQHWGQGNKNEFLNEAIALAKRGIISVLPDAVWLCPGTRISSFVSQGPLFYTQGVINIRTAVDLMQARFRIDPKYIIYVGHSYGCNLGAIISVVEPRFSSAVFMAGVYSTTAALSTSADPDVQQWRNADTAAFRQWLQRMRPLDAEWYLPHKTIPCLIQVADKDEFITNVQNQRFIDLTAAPKEVHWYSATHQLNDTAAKTRVAWIMRQLRRS
jgi:cephalosporin-C deacetylase-like acetyl esterase